jgi:hypothetical protein
VFDAIGTKIAQGEQTENIDEALAATSRIFITAGKQDQAVPDMSRFTVAIADGLKGMADSDSDGLVLGTEVADYVQTHGSSPRNDPQWGYLVADGGWRGNIAFHPSDLSAVQTSSDLTPVEKTLKSEQ